MRTFAIVCLAGLVLVSAAPAAAQSTGNQAGPLVKETQPTGKPTFEGRVEGETIETAFVIDYLPFEDSGDTCPFLHDYDEACPYTFSASPDVVYSYYCPFDCTVVIDLCASQYDTKVFVYENEYSPGNPFACNDDSPGCGPDGYRSWLMLEFTQGNTYFVVVDGYTCGLTELTETLAAGTWWLWVGPIGFTGVQCGEEYACERHGLRARDARRARILVHTEGHAPVGARVRDGQPMSPGRPVARTAGTPGAPRHPPRARYGRHLAVFLLTVEREVLPCR